MTGDKSCPIKAAHYYRSYRGCYRSCKAHYRSYIAPVSHLTGHMAAEIGISTSFAQREVTQIMIRLSVEFLTFQPYSFACSTLSSFYLSYYIFNWNILWKLRKRKWRVILQIIIFKIPHGTNCVIICDLNEIK